MESKSDALQIAELQKRSEELDKEVYEVRNANAAVKNRVCDFVRRLSPEFEVSMTQGVLTIKPTATSPHYETKIFMLDSVENQNSLLEFLKVKLAQKVEKKEQEVHRLRSNSADLNRLLLELIHSQK